jgi:hypothetical protein
MHSDSNSSSRCSSSVQSTFPDVFSNVGRAGYPSTQELSQPWKKMGLVTFAKDNVVDLGSTKWSTVMVACATTYDMGTGGLGGH